MSARLAPDVRRVRPELLVGGSPVRALRLSAAGRDALDALLAGRDHPGAGVLAQRLGDAGMLLADPPAGRLDDVTVVMPLLGDAADVPRIAATVPDGVPLVVVDDGNAVPLAGTGVIRHETTRGPAAARNTGARRVHTDLIAFVDADVTLPPGWLARLTGHFADQRVVAVAPRIVSARAPGWAGIVEHDLGALDQGTVPAVVGPGRRVSYVPTAVLVVRRGAFEAVDGFDEAMQVGEDVDLVWRLAEHGVVRYEPAVVVRHRPRATVREVLRRRYLYGTSAAPLDRRHPGRLRHLSVSVWSALPWLAALVHPAAGPATAAALVAAAPRSMRSLPPAEAHRVAAQGQWASFGAAGRFAVRPGLPLTLLALLGSRRARRLGPVLGLAYLAGSFSRLAQRPAAQAPARLLLHVLDDLAYSAGVWRSAVGARRPAVLVPRIVGRSGRGGSSR